MLISLLQRHFCIRSIRWFWSPAFWDSSPPPPSPLHFTLDDCQQKTKKETLIMTFASLSPSSLFTTLSWVASAWSEGRKKRTKRKKRLKFKYRVFQKLTHYIYLYWYFCINIGAGSHSWLALFPSSMSTTSCCAYSWISVSHVCGEKSQTLHKNQQKRR